MSSSTIKPRFAYAANRKIGLACLKLLIKHNWIPGALLIPAVDLGTYTKEMKENLPGVKVAYGKDFRSEGWIADLASMELDYIISVHFPYIITPEVLKIPKIGALNLHPSYLPYNKGWHTPTWAIYDKTPYGATLHWMDEGLDTGDIALQKEVKILPEDTAHSLYQRVMEVEKEIFKSAIPMMIERKLPRISQVIKGTSYKRGDIVNIQELILEEEMKVEKIIRILKALTTDRICEAAYFEQDGKHYRIRIKIDKEEK